MNRLFCNAVLMMLLMGGGVTAAHAQEAMETPAVQAAEEAVPVDNALPAEGVAPAPAQPAKKEVVPLSVRDEVAPDQIPSLFFTPEALALLRDAIEGLNTTTVIEDPDNPQDPGIRELALGGIVFNSEDDWAIWLNGRRITPNAMPGEIFDLQVYKEYIDIKWYDAYTNRLFPIRLRANERFNLDSRLFLTGSHSDENQL